MKASDVGYTTYSSTPSHSHGHGTSSLGPQHLTLSLRRGWIDSLKVGELFMHINFSAWLEATKRDSKQDRYKKKSVCRATIVNEKKGNKVSI